MLCQKFKVQTEKIHFLLNICIKICLNNIIKISKFYNKSNKNNILFEKGF